uniref:AlNc14C72G4931 protein n=1 Tax=Albugo laibachii Nc14 TaxID=890382 RepID=F0WE75_9STRA|nr:AlNc14C72G4931 [Albugo laibachii Nc14]|eukprot:CCA19504.1 AlNc14C72G4931 [Albugo laibachii Nc14]
MPKRKADAWPPSLTSDPDILSVDHNGRFVLCKVCQCHYALHGGKKPKPVMMNSVFRTRAWEVHKQRTNCHRYQNEKHAFNERVRIQRDDQTHSTQTHQTSTTTSSCATSSSSISSTGRPVQVDEQVGRRSRKPAQPITYTQTNKQVTNSTTGSIFETPDFPYDKPVLHNPNAKGRQRPPTQSSENLERWRIIHKGVARALDVTQNSNHIQSMGYHAKDLFYPIAMGKDTVSAEANKNHPISSNTSQVDSQTHSNSHTSGTEQAKQYWGTLRDLYKSDQGDMKQILSPIQPSCEGALSLSIKDAITELDDQPPVECAGDSEDFIEAHESGDHSLVNAIDRLTGVVSKYLFVKHTGEASEKKNALAQMLKEINEMRSHQESCFTRLLQLGERHVEVLEEMLEYKLRKENGVTTKSSHLEEE